MQGSIVIVQNRSASARTVLYDGQPISFAPRERVMLTWEKAQHVLKHSILIENRYSGRIVRWAEEVAEGVEASVLDPADEVAVRRMRLELDGSARGARAIHEQGNRSDKPFNSDKLEQFLSGMIQVYGPDLLRYKGVLSMKGNPRRVVFQGVHMMMGGDMGKPWGKDKKESILVFIGKKLPRDLFLAGLEQCLA